MQWNNTGFTVNFKYWAMYVSSHIKKKTIQKKPQNCFWYAYMFFSSFLQLTLILHFYLYWHTNNIQCVKFDYTFNKGSTHIFGILKKIKHSIKIYPNSLKWNSAIFLAPTISVYRIIWKIYHSRLSLHKKQEINDLRLPQHVSICRSTISLITLNKKINECIF